MVEPEALRQPFVWHELDMSAELPQDWQTDILRVVSSMAVARELTPTSVTSREADASTSIPVSSVGGLVIARELPWLDDLYRNRFRELVRLMSTEPVGVARDERYGINLNVQTGEHTSGYECHVDSNPIEGLLYVTSHPNGSGGELVVANRLDACDREQVDADAAKIHPMSGHLVFFDARRHPHYVSPLKDPADLRVVVAMNYYTPSCPEDDRPPDLNEHLFGEA